MSEKQIVFLSVFFILSLSFVLRMIVRHRLREVYAVVWVLVTFSIPLTIFLFPFFSGVSVYLGISSPFNLAVFVGFVISYGLLLHFSVLNSGLQRNIKNTIQKIAILENEVNNLKTQIKPDKQT